VNQRSVVFIHSINVPPSTSSKVLCAVATNLRYQHTAAASVQSSAGRGVLKAAGRAAATSDVNGCRWLCEFAPTASRWSTRSSLPSPGCRNPILEIAVQQWDHSDPMLYRQLYHAGMLYIAAAPVHALISPPPPMISRPVVTEWMDWQLMSCPVRQRQDDKTRETRTCTWGRVGTCTQAVGRHL
jgi:hypothetical protein